MIDCIGLLPETWRRVFSYCDAEALGRFLIASYHSDSHLHWIAREMAITNLEARILSVFEQDGDTCREEKLKQFAKHLSSSECHAQSDGFSSISTDQSLKCCILWAYTDHMISFNKKKNLNRESSANFEWIIATGPLMADFHQPGDDSSSLFHTEQMEVYISTPFSWDPSTISNVHTWMSRGVHTNMYVTPIFSEDSVENRLGLVTQVDPDRDIHSYSFLHGDMGDPRWSHALVLGEDVGQNKMSIWADMHPRMETHLQAKFAEHAWLLSDAKSNAHQFVCTWQESSYSCDDFDYDAVIRILKGILLTLKRCNRP